jgi:formylmethanofuran dehydrogenase subunit E
MMIMSHTFEEFAGMVKAFHGSAAPGIMIGGSMVDLAYRCLPKDGLYDVICETGKCLPDAVQLLTLCSIGNGWLKIMDTGRFSLAFYDKYTGEGMRIFIDPLKLDAWPELRAWFLKLTPKKDQDTDRLMKEIKEAGSDICSVEKIQVSLDAVKGKKGGPTALCPSCGESYPSGRGDICPACKGGMLPYGSGPLGGGRVNVRECSEE